MIKLHPVVEADDKKQDSNHNDAAVEETEKEKVDENIDLCRCKNPIWRHSTSIATDSVSTPTDTETEADSLSNSPSGIFWTPRPIDIQKTTPSPREYALMNAAEKGDLKAVEDILNNSEPCPLVASKAIKAYTRKQKNAFEASIANGDILASTNGEIETSTQDISASSASGASTSTTSSVSSSSIASTQDSMSTTPPLIKTKSIEKEKEKEKEKKTIFSKIFSDRRTSRFSISSTSTSPTNADLSSTDSLSTICQTCDASQPCTCSAVSTPNSNASLQQLVPEAFEDWRLRGTCACPNQEHRIDLRVGSVDNWSVLHYAARSGNAQILEALIMSCLPLDIDCQTKSKWTPLMMAADKGYADAVEMLLRFRADIHVISSDGKTAIFLARERNHLNISQRLTQASSERHRQSIIHGVLQDESGTILSEDQENLLANIANANTSTKASGSTITTITENPDEDSPQTKSGNGNKDENNSKDIVDISNSPTNDNPSTSTPTTPQSQSVTTDLPTRLSNTSIALSSNATLSSRYSATPLQAELVLACEYGDILKLKRILNLSVQIIENQRATLPAASHSTLPTPECDLFARGIDNWTVFHSAARRGQTQTILFIIETLAAVRVPMVDILSQLNAVTKNGWTALMMATDRGFLDTVKLLVINCGVDVNKIAPPNYTALSLALEHGDISPYKDISNVLKEYSKIN